MAVRGDFQEERRHRHLLISQHNSMSNLLSTDAICMDTIRNFVSLHNNSTTLLSDLVIIAIFVISDS